jgi:hypothetical protein
MSVTDVPFWGPGFAALQEQDAGFADVVVGELARLRGGRAVRDADGAAAAELAAGVTALVARRPAYPRTA